jgi:hypothetical protein
MKTILKAFAASALTLLVAGSASAHGRVRVYTEVRPYYPPVVQVAPPVYYQEQYVYVEPDWRARHAWRHEQWRREHWRREHWRREHWRRDHWGQPYGPYYDGRR